MQPRFWCESLTLLKCRLQKNNKAGLVNASSIWKQCKRRVDLKFVQLCVKFRPLNEKWPTAALTQKHHIPFCLISNEWWASQTPIPPPPLFSQVLTLSIPFHASYFTQKLFFHFTSFPCSSCFSDLFHSNHPLTPLLRAAHIYIEKCDCVKVTHFARSLMCDIQGS